VAGIGSLTGSVATTFTVNSASNTQTGSAYNPLGTSVTLNKKYSLGTANANSASGGADQVFSFQQGIVAGGSVTVDLYAMTNLLQQASIAIARIKAYQFRLLSATDDPTINPAPVNTSTGTVTNFGVATPCQLDFGTGGSGLTVNLTVSGGAIQSASVQTAGSLYPPSATLLASVNQAGGSGAALYIQTNASGVPTTVGVITGGNGYSNALVSVTVLGQYTLTTGGAHMYFDTSAAGFSPVSSTSRNVKIYNNDPVNPITLEVDVYAGST
jgi:hypothetical protein